MNVTAICIRAMGTDLVAHSAFDALVRKMGFQDSLVSLWREDVWLLGYETGAEAAEETTQMLATRTGVFVNPNTHRYEIVGSDEDLPHGEGRGRGELGMIVWSYDDPGIRPVLVAVKERLGIADLTDARRLTVWWPGFAERVADPKALRDLASSMLSTLSRERGLLSNPHYQGSFLLEESSSPAELLSSIKAVEEKVGVK